MTRGAKGCLLAAGAMLVVLAVVAVAVTLAGGVRHGTVIQITIAGDIAEDTEDSLQSRLLGRSATPLRDITRAIDRARRVWGSTWVESSEWVTGAASSSAVRAS